MTTATTTSGPSPTRWQRLGAASLRAFHAYGNWLVGISWLRFLLLSLLLLLVTGILKDLPPFSWRYTRTLHVDPVSTAPEDMPTAPPTPASGPAPGASRPAIRIDKPATAHKPGVEITFDDRGSRIVPRPRGASAPPSGTASASAPAPAIEIQLPPGAVGHEVRRAVEQARQDIEEAIRDSDEQVSAARDAADEARRGAGEVASQARRISRDLAARREARAVHTIRIGDFLPNLAMLWIVASAILKITYKRQIQAEAQAAQAVETADAESLRRQLAEARMAAMQAQVEPHFLFNTLASIDHLIEVDPKRASQMQKNLIALLRASMPTMREADGTGIRDLGRELAVIRPYLEILKVRMEERLATAIDVPDGLLSAEFPPMMVQTLVENAIQHGLEPKPEGGLLTVKAEVVHGKLALTVADTGLGFGRAATAGTGVGLANIGERLQLLYGAQASLKVTENPGGGTRVTISLPYRPLANGKG